MTDEQFMTHQWLNRPYTMTRRELAAKEEARDKAFSNLSKGSKSYDEIDVQRSKKNGQEERQHLFDDLETEVERLKEKIAKTRASRLQIIDKLESETERTILVERYINEKSFAKIGNMMNYSERQVQRKRLQALDNIKKFIPEEQT